MTLKMCHLLKSITVWELQSGVSATPVLQICRCLFKSWLKLEGNWDLHQEGGQSFICMCLCVQVEMEQWVNHAMCVTTCISVVLKNSKGMRV